MVAAVTAAALRVSDPSSIARLAEREFLGELLAMAPDEFPAAFADASRVVLPGDFADLDSRALCCAIFSLANRGEVVTLPAVADELSRAGDLELVGLPALAELSGEALGSDIKALADARLVHRFACRRRLADAAERWQAEPENQGLRAEVARAQEALDACAGERVSTAAGVGGIGFNGARLLALLDRPRPDPIEAGRPVPGHFMLIVAPPFVGKSSLIQWAAMARAAGVSPWAGAAARPAGRVLLYTLDEAPEQVARRMHGLSTFHPAGSLSRCADRLIVIGPDREIDPSSLDALRFDGAGLATLQRWLEDAEAEGDPFAEVYVDAYADVLPAGETENSNEEATRIGGALERLAVRFGCAVVVLHHAGKPPRDAKGEEPDIRSLSRGASALAAKARVLASLEVVEGMPHVRRLRTKTNLGPAPRSVLFEVASADGADDDLLYFKPTTDAPPTVGPSDYIEPGESITTTQLAQRLAGKALAADADPPGEFKKRAGLLREQWRKAGLVDVTPGKRKSKNVSLRDTTSGVNGAR